MRVSIIGAGLQCNRRAPVLVEREDTEIVSIAAQKLEHAEAACSKYGGEPTDDWRKAIDRKDVDAVIIATPPHIHADISIAAMELGQHVLCEKPLTRTVEEAERMVAKAKETGKVLKCGFNHRFHPAVWEAKQMMDRGELGKPLFARCRYGICGRPGYENEWRADPEQAAGGQFLEQGIHGMDLFRWFLGEITEVTAMTSQHYFRDQPLDDGGMGLFRAENGATASLHTTLVQWQNMFSFEVFGEDGYAQIEGLGASYGNEKLITGKRDFTAPFQDHVVYFRGGDKSWKIEWEEFVRAIDTGEDPIGNGNDGLASMKIALAAYEAERQGKILPIT